MNIVTRRDTNLPLLVDKFVEEFVGCYIISLVNLYSRYNQITLNPKSRDIIAFFTPLRLLRYITLPIGATNSVA